MDKLTKKSQATRRRRQNADLEGLDFLKDSDDAVEKPLVNQNSVTSERRSNLQHSGKKGGWGSEEHEDKELVDLRLQKTSLDLKAGENDDDDDDIPVIPTLDDMQEREFSTTIASAPSASVEIASMNELENALQKHSAIYTLDGEIDLKALARSALSPEAEVIEDDRKWDWNILFTQVTSELRADMDRQTGAHSHPGDTKTRDDALADLL